MEERYRRIVTQRAGGKTCVELVEHVAGHWVQISERLRAELDPDQLDELRVRMDHALDAVGDRGGIRREEARIEALDAAGRGDGARDQEQAGGIGQEACIGKRLPGALELGRRTFGLAPEAEAGFFAGLADRGNCKR